MGVLLFKLLSVSSYVYSHVAFRLAPLLNRGNTRRQVLERNEPLQYVGYVGCIKDSKCVMLREDT